MVWWKASHLKSKRLEDQTPLFMVEVAFKHAHSGLSLGRCLFLFRAGIAKSCLLLHMHARLEVILGEKIPFLG